MIRVLSQYGIELSQNINSVLESRVVFPDEYKKKSTGLKLLINTPSPCTGGNFRPHKQHIHLRLTKTMSLLVLHALVQDLTTFLNPLERYVNRLVYFTLNPSKFFSAYIRHQLNEKTGDAKSASIHILKEALQETDSLLIKVLHGTAMYSEITAAGSLVLESLDIDGEFSNLLQCSRFSFCDTLGLTGMKNLLKLIQFASHIRTINKVCQQYQLENCKNDPQLEILNKVAEKLSEKAERDKLTPEEAQPMWQVVCSALCLKEDANPKSLELFPKVADSTDFYQFLEEKQFTGTKGSARFHQQFELITAQLQHEEYRDVVLNHLLAAFRFIAPFLDRSHSLKSLMLAVAALELPEGLPQLETVKCNMHQIRYWFSQAEDTLENVSRELDDILHSGRYHIISSLVSGKNCLHLVLEYECSRAIPVRRPRRGTLDDLGVDAGIAIQQARTQPQAVNEKLSSAQVDDFVRQLGFLDANKDEQRVQDFLHLNEVIVAIKLQLLTLPALIHYYDSIHAGCLQAIGIVYEAQRTRSSKFITITV